MASDPKLSFEFYPPQTEEGVKNLKNTASELNKFNPEFFSVTFGAGGSTKEKTLDTVLALGKSGFNDTILELRAERLSVKDFVYLTNQLERIQP